MRSKSQDFIIIVFFLTREKNFGYFRIGPCCPVQTVKYKNRSENYTQRFINGGVIKEENDIDPYAKVKKDHEHSEYCIHLVHHFVIVHTEYFS
jgi:hypothetical protein